MAAAAWYWQASEVAARDLLQRVLYSLKLLYFLTPRYVRSKLTAEPGRCLLWVHCYLAASCPLEKFILLHISLLTAIFLWRPSFIPASPCSLPWWAKTSPAVFSPLLSFLPPLCTALVCLLPVWLSCQLVVFSILMIHEKKKYGSKASWRLMTDRGESCLPEWQWLGAVRV